MVTTMIEAKRAKNDLVSQLGGHEFVNGVGIARNNSGAIVLRVNVPMSTGQDDLDLIPDTIRAIPVVVRRTGDAEFHHATG